MPMLRRAVLGLLLILAPASFPAAASARPMTPQDIARLETVAAVAISADGSRIAYTTASRPDVSQGHADGPARQALFLADGPLAARAFLPEGMDVSAIAFTPDGSAITFLHAAKGEKRALWGIPVAGGAYRKLAAIRDADVLAYAFAPAAGSASGEVYLIAAPAPDERREQQRKAGFVAEVFEEELPHNRLFVAPLGREVDAAPRALAVPGHVTGIDLAGNGRFAVLLSAPTPLVDDSYTAKRAHILDLASGRVLVVETPGKLGDIAISPDGRHLSMIAATDASDPADTTLHLVDVATGSFSALNAGAPEAAMDAVWLADGRLAAVIHKGVQSVLRFYSAQGRVLGEHDPGELILAGLREGGNRLVAIAHAPRHPAEMFLFTGSGFERWTGHNGWLAEIDFGAQRAIAYTARDGQAIEGILIEPAEGVDFGGSPTILDVHGGPEAHESNGWLTAYNKPGQVAAGAGYAVFLPNYRGSTGYGTAFSRQHQGDAAGKEFDDLVDARAALVDMGIADAARVGITGGSYGGYATAWSATRHSAEFAAGVMFVGISNLLSKFGTTDIPTEEYLVHARAHPWDDYAFVLERSPVTQTATATTPLLILHGNDDPRVSPTQSMELYRTLKVRRPQTPVRLVRYPGEGHGNALATSRYDYHLRMMEWFATYLKSGNRTAALPPPRPELSKEAAPAAPAPTLAEPAAQEAHEGGLPAD